MISIGNDIVDLTAIDRNRTQQKAFYSKILSDTEQQLYSRSPQIPFEIYVWLLWSAKESVYKFAKRLNPGLVFSPPRIECRLDFSESWNFQNLILDGIQFDSKAIRFHATYQTQTYYLTTFITSNFIATLASETPKSDHIYWGIKRIDQSDYDSQSLAARKFTMKSLNAAFPNEASLSIDKSPVGYPVILKGQQETDIKASFSHHGNYVAYAFGK